MNKPPVAPQAAEPRNPGITKKIVVQRTRTSPLKVFLRSVYWLVTLAVVAIVLYISFEAGWMIYKNTAN